MYVGDEDKAEICPDSKGGMRMRFVGMMHVVWGKRCEGVWWSGRGGGGGGGDVFWGLLYIFSLSLLLLSFAYNYDRLLSSLPKFHV